MKPEDLGTYYESILDKEARKGGGVYYTPPFIVDYMVENSLGTLLEGKTVDEVAAIKIVDPSCGAGVFLLGVYQFLLDWHEKHFGNLTLEKRLKIVTDNIFGVDIDPLAVEITKYCLSMKCSEGKDFTLDLNENIRCGNSLIDTDFCWQKNFPHVFKQGGFDIVIGNPPYVEAKKLKAVAAKLRGDYKVYSGTADLSVYFIERGLQLCKPNGFLLYITTNKFFNTEYGKLVRSFLLKRQIRLMLNFEQVAVFSNSLVSTVILGVNNAPVTSDTFRYQKYYRLNRKEVQSLFPDAIKTQGTYQQSLLGKGEWSFADTRELALKEKIESAGKRIEKIECISVFRGVTTGYNPAFIIDQQKKQELIQDDAKNKKLIKPLLQGRNIRRWVYNASDKFRNRSRNFTVYCSNGFSLSFYQERGRFSFVEQRRYAFAEKQ